MSCSSRSRSGRKTFVPKTSVTCKQASARAWQFDLCRLALRSPCSNDDDLLRFGGGLEAIVPTVNFKTVKFVLRIQSFSLPLRVVAGRVWGLVSSGKNAIINKTNMHGDSVIKHRDRKRTYTNAHTFCSALLLLFVTIYFYNHRSTRICSTCFVFRKGTAS